MLKKIKNTVKRILTCSIPGTKHSFLFPYCFIILFLLLFPFNISKYDFIVQYGNDVSTSTQLCYNTGNGWNEANSLTEETSDNAVSFSIDNSINSSVLQYRLDPTPLETDMVIDYIAIEFKNHIIKKYSGTELKSLVLDKNDIQKITVEDNKLSLDITGTDSQLIFKQDLVSSINTAIDNYVRIRNVILATFLFGLFMTLIAYQKELFDFIKNLPQITRESRVDKLSAARRIFYFLSFLLVVLAVILYTIGQFLIENFSGLSFDEIIFHLKVPMEGTSNDMITQYFEFAGVVLAVCGVILLLVICLLAFRKKIRNIRYVNTISILLALVLFGSSVWNFSAELNLPEYISLQLSSSSFIQDNYVDAGEVTLTYPEKKRNLIYIYLESMESTFSSKEEGGAMNEDLIPELTSLANDNINFSESDLLGGATSSTGTGWTIAAMVAQTSGMPLLIPIDGNSYGDYSTFLPGAVSLGDLLQEAGYNQEIMVGSDLTFGGRRLYFTQHGDYQVYDLKTAKEKEKIAEDYYVWWGFEDKKLFSYAKEEITRLAQQDEPFNFTMLTADTHHIGGYVCSECEDEHEAQYENVLSCSSRQVASFVKWIQKQDFYEDTAIVICGDHPTMDSSYMDKYFDDSQPRKVYNCFINASGDGTNSKNRTFNTFDLFPTTLAAIGVEIEGNRLGLGTNLFSGEKTLAEQYDLETIDDEFSKKSSFYRKEILGE